MISAHEREAVTELLGRAPTDLEAELFEDTRPELHLELAERIRTGESTVATGPADLGPGLELPYLADRVVVPVRSGVDVTVPAGGTRIVRD